MKSIISETNNLWGESFVSKYIKFYIDFRNAEKNWENIFDYEIIAFELFLLNIFFYWKRILVIGCQYVSKQSQDFEILLKRIFRADFLSDWSKYMTKILRGKFKQSFGPFNMLTVDKCSDTRLFRHLTNSAFCSL